MPVELRGRVDGRQVQGQDTLTRTPGHIEQVWLEPAAPAAVPAAVAAVAAADLVAIGPGSTFTSLIPNLLVPDLASALVGRPEQVVYVCNLGRNRRRRLGSSRRPIWRRCWLTAQDLPSGRFYASGRPTRRHARVRCMPSPSSRPKWYMPSWWAPTARSATPQPCWRPRFDP